MLGEWWLRSRGWVVAASALACNPVSAQRTQSRNVLMISKPAPLFAELFWTAISSNFTEVPPPPVADITPPLALAVWPMKLSKFFRCEDGGG